MQHSIKDGFRLDNLLTWVGLFRSFLLSFDNVKKQETFAHTIGLEILLSYRYSVFKTLKLRMCVIFEEVHIICVCRRHYIGQHSPGTQFTLAKTETIYPKNVRAKIAMDFT